MPRLAFLPGTCASAVPLAGQHLGVFPAYAPLIGLIGLSTETTCAPLAGLAGDIAEFRPSAAQMTPAANKGVRVGTPVGKGLGVAGRNIESDDGSPFVNLSRFSPSPSPIVSRQTHAYTNCQHQGSCCPRFFSLSFTASLALFSFIHSLIITTCLVLFFNHQPSLDPPQRIHHHQLLINNNNNNTHSSFLEYSAVPTPTTPTTLSHHAFQVSHSGARRLHGLCPDLH